MRRIPLVLPAVSIASLVALLALASAGCAERTKSEEAPAPSAPIPVTNANVIASSAMTPVSPIRMRKMIDLRHVNLVKPPASVQVPPVADPATDAAK